jgi:hypothetical protein
MSSFVLFQARQIALKLTFKVKITMVNFSSKVVIGVGLYNLNTNLGLLLQL